MGKKHNILVIDDEENTRLLIAEELLEAGYKVDQAASTEEARKKIESNSYDLVTLDIEMPGMNGVEFAGFLRKEIPGLRIVLLTAYSHYRHDLSSWAADAYVVKSPDLTELKETIKKLLEM